MYTQIKEINSRPKAFEFYTADVLWTDSHTSKKMTEYHLNDDIEAASRNSKFVERSVDWIKKYFSISHSSKVCDFGCAIGLYTSALARCGASVTGLDFSARSIEYAKNDAAEHKLDVDYKCMNYLDFKSEEVYDLIIMIMCDFCALSPLQRRELLKIFYDSIADNGAVLLDVHTMHRYDSIEESTWYEQNQLFGFWSENDYYAFVNTFKYDKERVVLDKYTIFEESGRKVVYNWLQHFSKEDLLREFEEAGFAIKGIYANVAGDEYAEDLDEMAIVAVKA